MIRKLNLVGRRFGRLLVVSRKGKTLFGQKTWKCKCDCGKEKTVRSGDLLEGKVKSCGCLRYQKKYIIGKRFGRLVVLRFDAKKKNMHRMSYYICRCDCGKIISTQRSSLVSGNGKSCGCLKNKLSSQRITGKLNPNFNHFLTYEERISTRENALNDRWVKDIFKRDKYSCQICFEKSHNIHAHHLDGYHWAKDKRLDLKNGITLCVNCHNRFHKTYGLRNNTKEQFLAFLALGGKLKDGRIKVRIEKL